MAQAADSDTLIYDDADHIFFNTDVSEIGKWLLKDITNLCDQFVDNRLSVPSGQEKTKSILFSTKFKVKNAKTIKIASHVIKIKQ